MITVIPYDAAYDVEIRRLENIVSQGKQVTLKIIKNHFLDRSSVFEKSFPVLSIDTNKKLTGTCVGVQTNLVVNGQEFEAGFALDAKVDPMYRNQGTGRMMAKYVYEHFFKSEGLNKNFITLKLKNVPVIKLSSKAVGKIWLYDFVYLTIPTNREVEGVFQPKGDTKLSVKLFSGQNVCAGYYENFSNGLGCFNTYKMYRLKITRISWLYKRGLSILKRINRRRYSDLPQEKEIIKSASLYGHTEKNVQDINIVLNHLHAEKINYLMVCCRKNDSIYNYLKRNSINTYSYYILADFELLSKDNLAIDVRCL